MTTITDPGRTERRRRREHLWIAGVVLYTVVRFAIAWETLNRYGLNVWIFGILDVGTAVPYAIGTARLVTCVVDKRLQAAAWWLVLAAASFIAPYLYIAIAGRDKSLPILVWIVLGLLVLGLGANAVMAINKRISAEKRVQQLEA